MTTDGTWTYTYDDAGQATGKSKTGVTWTYEYDLRGQLVEASDGTTTVTYAYDAFGNRIARTEDDGIAVTEERYVVDGWDTAKPGAVGTENFDIVMDLDGDDDVIVRRLFGPGFDDLVGGQDGGGTVRWYGTDHLGSVRKVFDNSGAVTNTVDYDAFGGFLGGVPVDRYAYTGREWDATTGLTHYRAREKDGHRFLTEDPKGFGAGDANLARYVGNGALNARDPSGMQFPPSEKLTPANPPPQLQGNGAAAPKVYPEWFEAIKKRQDEQRRKDPRWPFIPENPRDDDLSRVRRGYVIRNGFKISESCTGGYGLGAVDIPSDGSGLKNLQRIASVPFGILKLLGVPLTLAATGPSHGFSLLGTFGLLDSAASSFYFALTGQDRTGVVGPLVQETLGVSPEQADILIFLSALTGGAPRGPRAGNAPAAGNAGPRIDINPVEGIPNSFAARWTQGQAQGGMSYKVNPAENSVSIDAIKRGDLMPPRSAGPNAAAALKQHGISKPKLIEMYNVVEESTLSALKACNPAQGTTLGKTMQNMADSLGGKITKWEVVRDGSTFHIRAHLEY